ncbi:beta-1,6-N-acetylglucosaminyltransferase [Mucilaginibacter sp. CSA2-8R]|uniref:beta-1,6-N-acetylglucosaminyltransferase n=1 Tax=Mucilaginibacter sp. CSA2-8R TaxID=3141542 RepID=UPI00315CD2DE
MKNHAFLIQAHAYPNQLFDIVNLLKADNHFFFINIDAKNSRAFTKQDLQQLKRIKNVHLSDKNIIVNHGGFSQIECTISLLKQAFNHPVNIDYFHSLSGQDYPCMNNSNFDGLFENNNNSYMHFDSPGEITEWQKDKYPWRINNYHLIDELYIPYLNVSYPSILTRLALKVNDKLKLKRSEIPNLIGGWSWFSWHRKVTEYVLNYLSDNPSYLKRFKLTCCGDEIIFHTLLNDVAEELGIEKYNSLRYIEWHPKRESPTFPLVLDEREYDDITKSGAVFCRKLHPEKSEGLIERLKERINRNFIFSH